MFCLEKAMTFKTVTHFSRLSRRQFLGFSAGIAGFIVPASAFADRPRPAGKIAFVSGRFAFTTQQKIWIISADGSNLRRLTKDGGEPGEDHPAWSPDGRQIAFSAVRKGKRLIYIRDSDGKNERPLIPEAALAEDSREPAWSPDGKTIVFCAFRADQKSAQISVISADGTNLRQLTSGESYNSSPCFSPYGEHIVFDSTRDGNRQIYAMNADGSNLLNLSTPVQPDS
jgi:TolB protein